MKRRWDNYWYGEISPTVPRWLFRMVLLLLAFDAWVVMIDHGAKYGAYGFNVAHFGWLDAVSPLPTPGLYVGLLVFVGLLSCWIALVLPASRVWTGLLCAVYTYAWAMSQLDSYQHHYLLSIVLMCFTALPMDKIGAKSASKTLSAWPYTLYCCSVAIVYFYTGVSKTAPDWSSGSVLRAMGAADSLFGAPRQLALSIGFTESTFWSFVGHSVIGVQWLISAGYLAAPWLVRSLPARRSVSVLCGLAAFAALTFHIGAELLGLKIGWFSYYMLLSAVLVLIPWPSRSRQWLAAQLARIGAVFSLDDGSAFWRGTVGRLVLTALALGWLGFIGVRADLPGAAIGAVLAGVAVGAGLVVDGLRNTDDAPMLRAAGALMTGLCLWGALSWSASRYDFYRLAGGGARRRGERELAIEYYAKAKRYAPAGEWTAKREQNFQRLQAGGSSDE